jgi:hypothetical protein
MDGKILQFHEKGAIDSDKELLLRLLAFLMKKKKPHNYWTLPYHSIDTQATSFSRKS